MYALISLMSTCRRIMTGRMTTYGGRPSRCFRRSRTRYPIWLPCLACIGSRFASIPRKTFRAERRWRKILCAERRPQNKRRLSDPVRQTIIHAKRRQAMLKLIASFVLIGFHTLAAAQTPGAAFEKKNYNYSEWTKGRFSEVVTVTGPGKMIFLAGVGAEAEKDGSILHQSDFLAQ